MNKANINRQLNCAIYTRKSTDEGLDKEFNSLDAQRECAEAYIKSQTQEGWYCVPDRYDDGGLHRRQYGSSGAQAIAGGHRSR